MSFLRVLKRKIGQNIFEIQRPISGVDTSISDIHKVCYALAIGYQKF